MIFRYCRRFECLLPLLLFLAMMEGDGGKVAQQRVGIVTESVGNYTMAVGSAMMVGVAITAMGIVMITTAMMTASVVTAVGVLVSGLVFPLFRVDDFLYGDDFQIPAADGCRVAEGVSKGGSAGI